MASEQEKKAWLERVLGIRLEPDAPGADPAEAVPGATGVVAYAKSRLAWLDVRKRMAADLETLRRKMLEHYADEDIAADLEASYAERVAPVLAALDERLADTLDDATNATDPVERKALADRSREIIKGYQAFMANEPIFAEIDANPFVPLAFTKTMTASGTICHAPS